MGFEMMRDGLGASHDKARDVLVREHVMDDIDVVVQYHHADVSLQERSVLQAR